MLLKFVWLFYLKKYSANNVNDATRKKEKHIGELHKTVQLNFKFMHINIVIYVSRYGISYYEGDIVKPPLWPYVSDTGDFEPESCLFTFILNLAAILGSATFYFYYK